MSVYEKYLKRIGIGGFSCVHCGKPLKADDRVVDCADCGAIYCEACVKAGRMDGHACEED